MSEITTETSSIIGLIPAAGRGTRLGSLPFSKELLPLGVGENSPDVTPPRLAIDNALETMTSAGIKDTCIVIAPGKLDIPAHIGSGRRNGQSISYVIAEDSPNVPYSLDSAWSVVNGREVALLFPDIVFRPEAALKKIIKQRRGDHADLTLALVPASSGEKIDIVSVAEDGRVKKIVPKPGRDYTGWTWVAAIWNRRFTNFLHNTPLLRGASHAVTDREMYVADIINAALEAEYVVTSLAFPGGNSVDLGTPDDLERYRRSGLD